MENILVSLVLLVFAAYMAFHILILSRLIKRGAASLVVVYAMLRLITLPLIAVGAMLALRYPESQLGKAGIVIGVVAVLARLIIGGFCISRLRRTDSEQTR